MTDAREAIMEATFDALCEHGYANLTMAAIADEFEKSKSLIHYHYDSKDELMVAFLDWLLDTFFANVGAASEDDPVAWLARMADIVVGPDDDSRDFQTALLELRAQAPFDPGLREQLVANDREIRALIAEIVRGGQATGQFRADVDPEAFAAAFRSAIEGAQSHAVILGGDAPTEDALGGIETFLIDALLVEETDGGALADGDPGGDERDDTPAAEEPE